MSDLKRVGDLEINQDLEFLEKEWLFERIGWITMLIIAVAALLGLFGQGLLSNVNVKNGTIEVSYGRFERILVPFEYRVQIDPQEVKNGEIRIEIDRTLLLLYKIDIITPGPDSIELTPEKVIYTFKAQSGDQPLKLIFILLGNQIGVARGNIGIKNGPSVEISQFLWP